MTTNSVFVIDSHHKPLQPCSPATARNFLNANKAALLRRYPTTIILTKDVFPQKLPLIELRIDPGSKFTGIALVEILDGKDQVIWAMELEHRGAAISQELKKRAAIRRCRRNRNTRYRLKRFGRHKPEGWLAPSLMHRVDTTLTWVKRLIKFVPISSIAFERVKFDRQKLENPQIQGIEYQQGTLAGYIYLERSITRALGKKMRLL